ncbi:MAG: hypothetical protein WDZ93_01530 [Candidatus Paceibacterota bacterium]
MAPFLGNSKRTFATGLVLAVIVGGLGIAVQQRSIEQFSYMLHDAGVYETVAYQNRLYEVRGGVVVTDTTLSRSDQMTILRLAYAKRVLRVNPSIALPGIDIEYLEQGANQLQDVQERLSEYEPGIVGKVLVRHTLFPSDTLRAAGAAEKARRLFLEESTMDHLTDYLHAASRLDATYQRESILYEAAYRWFVRYDTIRVVTERHSITKENTLDTLQLLRGASRSAGQHVVSFTRCVTDVFAPCDATALRYPVVWSDTETVSNANTTYQDVGRLYQMIDTETGRDHERIHVTLERSWCLNPEVDPRVVVESPSRSHPLIQEGSDVRMIRVEDFLEVPFYRYFYGRGYTYVPASPFSHYACAAASRDIGAALTTRDVRQYALEHQLSGYLEETTDYESLRSLESITAEAVAEDRARAYIETALRYVGTGEIPQEHHAALADFALRFDRLTEGGGLLIFSIAVSEAANATSLDAGVIPAVEIDRIYFSRSAFVPFGLLLFASVSPGDVHEPFSLPRAETPYVYLSSVIEETSFTELVKEFISYHERQ